MPLPIRQAVFGNVGTLISFRVGHTDAEALHHEFGGTHIAQQFVDLEKFEILIRLLEDGANSEPFRAKTLAPVENPFKSHAILVMKSREKFSMPRRQIEQRLEQWSRPERR